MDDLGEPFELRVLLREGALEGPIVGVHELFEPLSKPLVEGPCHQTRFAFAEPEVEHSGEFCDGRGYVQSMSYAELPVIDIGAPSGEASGSCWSGPSAAAPEIRALRARIASELRVACEQEGFFYVRNHGVSETLQLELESHARAFFARPTEEKLAIAMAHGGRAWRGYFPVGGELTSSVPDAKEGIYFGAELDSDDPRVRAGVPLHGANLFPASPGFREVVLDYLAAMTDLGRTLMGGIAESLGLDADAFGEHFLREPLTLFRIFNYPAAPLPAAGWGVGEHTDYGLLTILKQSDEAGLEVKTRRGWIDAPPLPGTFLCNIGDMLERMTFGRYRSTPHRVRNVSGRARLSLPFFFDPSFDAEIHPLLPPPQSPVVADGADAAARWDGASVFTFRGTYGDYLLQKVSRVFPDLARGTL